MITILISIFLLYFICFKLSPFPYWKTYFYLWKTLLLNKNSALSIKSRFNQSVFLMRYILFCPLWTFFWYLDEIFYSQYKQLDINPIFITGQPRCGTTFLHRALAADSEHFVAIKHFEWRYPFISLQKFLDFLGLTKIIFQKNYWSKTEAGKLAAKMHPNRLSDWEEDGIFFEECFLHHFFIYLRFPYPEIFEYLDNFPQIPNGVQNHMLNIHRKVIQKMLYYHNGRDKFYLSKEVTSHDKILSVLKMYPNAKFIVNVRSSADFLSSLLPLVRYSTKSKTGIDPLQIPYWESKIIGKMRKDCDLLIDACNNHIKNENQIKVSFKNLMIDVELCIKSIFDFLQIALSSEYHNYLKSLNQNQETRIKGYNNEKRLYKGFHRYDSFVTDIDLTFNFHNYSRKNDKLTEEVPEETKISHG